MEWKKLQLTDQYDWEIQYDVMAFSGSLTIGRLVYSTKYGWQSIIDGDVECLYDAETEEDAKRDFKVMLENYLEDKLNYYSELCSMLKELD